MSFVYFFIGVGGCEVLNKISFSDISENASKPNVQAVPMSDTSTSTQTEASEIQTDTSTTTSYPVETRTLSEKEVMRQAILTNDVSTRPQTNVRPIDTNNYIGEMNQHMGMSNPFELDQEPITAADVKAKEDDNLLDYMKDSYKLIRVLCVWC